MNITYKTYSYSSIIAKWSTFMTAPSRFTIKELNLYFEAVACLAQKNRIESRRYFGREPAVIYVAYTKQQIDWLFQNSDSWATVIALFEGQINNFFPDDLLLQFTQLYSFIFSKVIAKDLLQESMLIFTDGSSNGRAAYAVNGEGRVVQTELASAQIVEHSLLL